MKKCYVCNIFKDFAEFSKNKRMNDGFNRKCKSCVREYRIKTKEKISEYGKRKYYENIEYNRLRNKNYRINNKEKMKCLKKNYCLNNKEKIKIYSEKRKHITNHLAKERRKDPQNRLRSNMSSMITRTLRNGKCGKSWFNLIPYSLEELKNHLESKFTKGMTWNNYGKEGWHIDHIIPRSFFDHSSYDTEDFQKCWALNNLQPLWATKEIAMSYGESSDYIGNLEKQNKIIHN
jgi:hypothetical protein